MALRAAYLARGRDGLIIRHPLPISPCEETAPPPASGCNQSGTARNGVVMSWIYLISAGILEIVWAFAMKQSDGLTRPLPAFVMMAGMAGSFVLLALAMRDLPLGTAYTIWTGIGAIGAFMLGVLMLGEIISPARVAAALLIISGIVLMKLSS